MTHRSVHGADGRFQPLSDPVSRFWSRVDKTTDPNGCWLWRGALDADGYGQFSPVHRESPHRAHRYSYRLAHGPIGSAFVLHWCDKPSCVNPAHLFIGSQLDNMRDKVRKGRQARGSRSGLSKLTEEQVRAIRSDSRSCRVIAAEYAIDKTNVSLLKRRKSWAWLPLVLLCVLASGCANTATGKVLNAGVVGAGVADLVTTRLAIKRGGVELNVLAGQGAIRQAVVKGAGIGIVFAGTAWLDRRGQTTIAHVLRITAIAVWSGLAIHNAGVRR